MTSNGVNILEQIVAHKRKEIEVAKKSVPLETLRHDAERLSLEKRPFRQLFSSEHAAVLIAEIKPKSPSEGQLIAGSSLDVADLYAKSAADVVSVLTDEKYFGGNLELLKNVRARVPQAVLRKDFIIDEYQVYETALSGADAFLLIAATLDANKLRDLIKLADSLGLGTLVEVHDEDDLKKTLSVNGSVLGINNRDLKTLKTDIAVTEELAKLIPSSTPFVAESGIETVDDVRRVRDAGASGILVGTSLLKSKDVLAKIAELKAALS